jgi:hypothetical protein
MSDLTADDAEFGMLEHLTPNQLIARIRELKAAIEEPNAVVAEAIQRAEKAEAERDVLKALHDVSLASCRVWKEAAEKAEAERDKAESALKMRSPTGEWFLPEREAIEAAMIERLTLEFEDLGEPYVARKLRALKSSGEP